MSLPEIKIKVSVLAYEKRKPLTALSQLNNDAGYVSADQLNSELLEMREWVKQQFLGEVAPLNQPLHGITILQRKYAEPPTDYVDCGSILNRGLPVTRAFRGTLPANFSEE